MYCWDKCAELEAKYPECHEEYEGDMPCEPSESDYFYYKEHCEDGNLHTYFNDVHET